MENQQLNNSTSVLTIDSIPPELHLKIFEYLTRNDIIAAQCVCCKWRTLAHDNSLWKDYTFVIKGTSEDEKKLKVMPALRNIDGYADNSFINIILDHVTNLNKMNCKFKPPISFVQVQSLVQRYPELKSITLDVCAPHILQSVEVLQTDANLQELIFHKQRPCSNARSFSCECSSLSTVISVLNMLADCKNFTTLNNLDVNGLIYYGAFEYPSYSNVFTRVLNNRSHQLQSFNFFIISDVDANIINALNTCSRIQTLCLSFFQKCSAIIDISRMTQLRFLSVHLYVDNDDFVTSLCDSFSGKFLVCLKDVNLCFFTPCQYKADILGALTKNASQLKTLHYWDLLNEIYDWQLEHIGNLSKLQKLSLSSPASISEKMLAYISHCHNLRYLYLFANSTNIANLNPAIASMICPMKHLGYLSFAVCNTINIELKNEEEIITFTLRYLNTE